MGNVSRSKSDLLALAADNTSKDISAQDLRDILESMHPSFGGMYQTAVVETTIETQNVFVKAAGTTAATNLHRFTNTGGRLTFVGTHDTHFFIVCTLSMAAASNNKLAAMAIAINGVPLTAATGKRRLSSASSDDIGSVALFADVTLSVNDYIEVWVANLTDTTNLQVETMYMFAMGMFT